MSYRYIGNKTRMIGILTELVNERVGRAARIADLMCGTASFAAAMRTAGHQVVAGDLMTFACHHARVRLTMRRAPSFRRLGMRYVEVIDVLNSLEPRHGFISREYGDDGTPAEGHAPRRYFSAANAARVDAIAMQIRDWHESGRIGTAANSLLRHDLVLAANRVANIAGTYGHYRSTWTPSSLTTLRMTPTAFSRDSRSDHEVRQGPAEVVAQGLHANLCYLDPPYTKRQYAANYHLPETLARGDEPRAVGASGLRPWRDQYSNFCSKRLVRASFQTVIEGMDCPRFLISYSEDGLLRREEMVELLEPFGRVRCLELKTQRFRSNQSPLSRDLTEYVFDLSRA